jgi:CRP-like cAMP-binding protein
MSDLRTRASQPPSESAGRVEVEPMSQTQKAAALAQVPLLSRLPPHEVTALSRVASERRLTAGQAVFTEGAPATGCSFVVSGPLVVTKGGAKVTTVQAGTHLGIHALNNVPTRQATVAVEAGSATVLDVPLAPLLALVERYPGFAAEVRQNRAQRGNQLSQAGK